MAACDTFSTFAPANVAPMAPVQANATNQNQHAMTRVYNGIATPNEQCFAGNCEQPTFASAGARRFDGCADNRELAGIRDDPCYVDCRANTARRPMKYQTRDFHYLGCNPQSLCYPGFYPDDGPGIPRCAVDVDSHLRIDPPLTNLGFPQQLRCLPASTVPFLGRGCLEPDTEMELRGKDTNGSKPCLPRETNFYERHFDFFDHLCYNPNAVENTVYPYNQAGMDTRHIRQEAHRNGINCRPLLAVAGGDLQNRNCDQKETFKYSAGRFDHRGNKKNVNLVGANKLNRFGPYNPDLTGGYKSTHRSCSEFNCPCGPNCKCGANCKCAGGVCRCPK